MTQTISKKNISCIMPFYNEFIENVISNIREVSKSKYINKIVVVDDGSKDSYCYEYLKYVFRNNQTVFVKRLDYNYGKTFAVYHALQYIPQDTIFLCDSDLKNLNSKEIDSALEKYFSLDSKMMILKRLKTSFFLKLLRTDTLLSGERILQKKDLINVIMLGAKNYQLEVAINHYFFSKKLNKKCYWHPSSAVNNYKYKKLKFLKGILKDFIMYINILSYIGFKNYTKHFLHFCKQKS